jgi:hypothetical protein
VGCKITVDRQAVARFCRQWKIVEFALFGSVLREDFRPGSDVDVLVTFAPDARWTLFDVGRMQEELKAMFGCEVDLVSRRGIEASQNWLRRRTILASAQVVYGA